jgi:peptidoglycan-N-acetylglucosamine deacetylase
MISMWKFIAFTSAICFVGGIVASAQEQVSAASYKGKPIICLTYDDALDSQLKNAIPQLDSFGMKGTFFLNSIRGSTDIIGRGSDILLEWKSASAHGHEFGNHTLFHPCPQKLGWQKDIAIENYTLEQLLNEVRTTHLYIDQIEGKRSKRSFAYPCNNVVVANKDYSEHLRKFNFISYARAGGDNNSIITDFNRLDKMKVPSWHVMEGTTGEELIAFVDKAIKARGLCIFQFHGIGGALFTVSSEAHLQLLKYLKDNEDKIIVTTFSQAMKIVKSSVH